MDHTGHEARTTPNGSAKPAAPDVRHVRSVLFVCLGNICRSPLAEGVFIHRATSARVLQQLRIDSYGTGSWHVGNAPDHRSVAVARTHGVALTSRARQLDPATDFSTFDLIVPMDRKNERDLLRHGCPREKLALCLAFVASDADMLARAHAYEVPDPYYGGDDGFETVFRLVDSAAAGLLDAMFDRTPR